MHDIPSYHGPRARLGICSLTFLSVHHVQVNAEYTGGCSISPVCLGDVKPCIITQNFTNNFQEFASRVDGLVSLWKLICRQS